MPPSYRAALSGALALAAAMGIGRFAYTALLPATQAALGFDDGAGGAIASANLVGYLAGVLVARGVGAGALRGALLRAGLATTVLSTAVLAAAPTVWSWIFLRLLAGVASAFVFVLVSAVALESRGDTAPHPGLLYSGVGAGIALTGATAALVPRSSWRGAWLFLAAVAAALSVPAWRTLSPSAARAQHVSASAVGRAPLPPSEPARPPSSLARLGAAYLLEGLGYIVSGTFAVVAVRRTPGLEALAPWTWSLAGLAAAPSALVWAALGRRIGLRAALTAAFLVQAGGMALPSLSSSGAAAVTGAIFFGGTFMGIVTLTMAAARVIVAPGALARAVGTLTALYGVGQIAGPLAAGALSRRAGDPRPAVLAAAAAVAIGGAVLAWPARRPSGQARRRR